MSSSTPVAASSVLTPHHPVDDPVVSARNLTKVYGRGSGAVTALDSVNVDIARARFTAIMGPSGSGKSTLMHCLAGLDSITSGEIMLDGDMVSSMSQRRLTRLRRERIGFIFQSFNLVPTLTAAENITLPLDIARKKVNPQRFDQVIDAVGLRERLSHRPAELSGGQVQRVACARALVGEPAVVFADEPTGNLDSNSGTEVLKLLRTAANEHQQTILMVTHDAHAASYADRVVFLKDGTIAGEMLKPTHDAVLNAMGQLEGE